jgi:hypothetical protein
MAPVATEAVALKIVLGAAITDAFGTGLPVIGGERVENLFPQIRPAGQAGCLSLYQSAGWLVGAATVPVAAGLEAATHTLYADILQAAAGWHLARIWNYVPAINETGPEGLENYHTFCRGRSRAFERQHGPNYKVFVPSASAVGCRPAALTVVFAASRALPRHIENPRQVPAYDYPPEYGPRSPSFARATVVPGGSGPTVFISGTAAIRGHATVAPHCTREQLLCTLDNLREISLACGLGPGLGATDGFSRFFKVYVRHVADQPAVAALLAERLLRPGDRVSYLHADICRQQLQVEIEATLQPAPPPAPAPP